MPEKITINKINPKLSLYKDVAIVGSDPCILNDNYGELIDSFNEVIRFNRAPIEGYEKCVGTKETLRVVNKGTFKNKNDLYKKGISKQPPDFVKKLKNARIVVESGKKHLNSKDIDKTSKFYAIQKDKVKTNVRKPTVGFLFICLIIENGITPHLFGFNPKEKNLPHYYEDNKGANYKEGKGVYYHLDLNKERQFIEKFNKEGKVVLHLNNI